MNSFKDFGIKAPVQAFTGDKIKMERILNREIVVHRFKVEPSKQKEDTQCLTMQIELNGEKRVIFTGARQLIDTIQRIPENGFPFTTTIVKENEHFEFT